MLVLCVLSMPLLGIAACTDGQSLNTSPDPTEHQKMLMVTTEGLKTAAETYAEYRRSTGFEVDVVTCDELLARFPGKNLWQAVQAGVEERALMVEDLDGFYLLIIGDALESDPENTEYVPMMPGPGEFSGDTPYGDLDGDWAPEIHIGRIPFRTEQEVLSYLDRVIAMEQSRNPGPWNKRISVVAGEGDFGSDIDEIFETVAIEVFDEMSYDFDVSMTYALQSSPYYLPSDLWDAQYAEEYNEGTLASLYIGHTLGSVPDELMEPPVRPCLSGFLSCSDGCYASSYGPYGSLAEELLLADHGPLVTMAATSWSHPYGNALLAREFGNALMNLKKETYGKILTAAKYNILYRKDRLRTIIDSFAKEFVEETLEELCDQAVVIYNILGDPASLTRIPAGQVTFDDPGTVHCQEPVVFSGSVTTDGDGADGMKQGQVVLTVEVERGVILHELEPQDPHDPEVCLANHAIANDKVAIRAEGTVQDGSFNVEITLPSGLPSVTFYLKGYARNDEVDAVGSMVLKLDRQSCR